MSYGFPSKEPAQRRTPAKAGGSIIFFVIVAIVGFMLFSKVGRQPAGGGAGAQPSGGIQQGDAGGLDSASNVEQNVGSKKMPTTGDSGAARGWEAGTVDKPQTSKSTTADGWSTGEVEKNPSRGRDGVDLKFSNQQQPAESGWSTGEVKKKNGWSTEAIEK